MLTRKKAVEAEDNAHRKASGANNEMPKLRSSSSWTNLSTYRPARPLPAPINIGETTVPSSENPDFAYGRPGGGSSYYTFRYRRASPMSPLFPAEAVTHATTSNLNLSECAPAKGVPTSGSDSLALTHSSARLCAAVHGYLPYTTNYHTKPLTVDTNWAYSTPMLTPQKHVQRRLLHELSLEHERRRQRHCCCSTLTNERKCAFTNTNFASIWL